MVVWYLEFCVVVGWCVSFCGFRLSRCVLCWIEVCVVFFELYLWDGLGWRFECVVVCWRVVCLRGVCFKIVSLRGCVFEGLCLKGVCLRGRVCLRGCEFKGCVFEISYV